MLSEYFTPMDACRCWWLISERALMRQKGYATARARIRRHNQIGAIIHVGEVQRDIPRINWVLSAAFQHAT